MVKILIECFNIFKYILALIFYKLVASQLYSVIQARHFVHLKKITLLYPGRLSATEMFVNTFSGKDGYFLKIFISFPFPRSILALHIGTYMVCGGTTIYVHICKMIYYIVICISCTQLCLLHRYVPTHNVRPQSIFDNNMFFKHIKIRVSSIAIFVVCTSIQNIIPISIFILQKKKNHWKAPT